MRVQKGDFGPSMARNAGSGSQREEMIVTLHISGESEGNAAEQAAEGSVDWVLIVKNLSVGAELDAHGGIIWGGGAGDNGCRTENLRHAITQGNH